MNRASRPTLLRRWHWLRTSLLASFFYGAITTGAIAADLETIKQRGYLIVGVQTDLAPLSWQDAQGQWQGFEVDLARSLAAEILGNPASIRFQGLRSRDRIPALLDDRVDILIAQMTVTDSRRRVVQFSQPYYRDRIGLLSLRGTLDPQRVAVLQGSSAIPLLRWQAPEFQLVGVENYAAAQAALQQGQVEAIAADRLILQQWQRQDPRYQLLPQQWGDFPLAIALPQGLQYRSLQIAVDRVLQKWKADDKLRDMKNDWGL
ncbi:transporter substrate-binding domain-containing protein [Synechococcus elongatus IITB7]|uniref:transporter substrate-binding domain-containing protein n=1 Tax=Synechococcus elongatus TaxID=32046 RepID=UPI0030D42390